MRRGIAICHYNRPDTLKEVMQGVFDTIPPETRVVLCDDGSDTIMSGGFPTISGPNLGVSANKNRALWALQDCQYIAILEDDLVPTESGWFEIYEEVAALTNNHHFCRVQDKQVPDNHPEFTAYLQSKGYTPLFATSPRGDLTFITNKVVQKVGAFNREFRGAGYAHGAWSARVWAAGLISHPLRWWDVKEARDKFVQKGDTIGGRWNHPEKTKEELERNKEINKRIRAEIKKGEGIHIPLILE